MRTKDKIQRLEERIERLENGFERLKEITEIRRYGKARLIPVFYPGFAASSYDRFGVDRVINLVLEHLKLDIKAIPGIPGKEMLVPVKKEVKK